MVGKIITPSRYHQNLAQGGKSGTESIHCERRQTLQRIVPTANLLDKVSQQNFRYSQYIGFQIYEMGETPSCSI